MTIRPAQIQTFTNAATAQFVEQMVKHVRALAPELAGVAQDQGVRAFVENTIEAAHAVGFYRSECLRFFIESALVLGHRFYDDPQYGWVREVLDEKELDTEDLRADILSRYTLDYLRTVAGPSQAFVVAALQRLEDLMAPPFEHLPRLDPEGLMDLIRKCYPEKFDFVGRGQMQLLVAKAAETADALGLRPSLATPFLTLTMVAFGHGVVDDPLYPWVATSLKDPAAGDPRARLERLYTRTRVYLGRVLTSLREP